MSEDRRSPMFAQLVLLAGFVLLVAASIATVLVPELLDDGADEETAQPRANEAAAQ